MAINMTLKHNGEIMRCRQILQRDAIHSLRLHARQCLSDAGCHLCDRFRIQLFRQRIDMQQKAPVASKRKAETAWRGLFPAERHDRRLLFAGAGDQSSLPIVFDHAQGLVDFPEYEHRPSLHHAGGHQAADESEKVRGELNHPLKPQRHPAYDTKQCGFLIATMNEKTPGGLRRRTASPEPI